MKRIAFAFARLVVAFFAIFVVVGCSGRAAIEDANVADDLRVAASRPAARPETVTDAMVEEGQQIYAGAGICAVCHGPDATGAIGPDLTDAEWLLDDGEYEQIVARILSGVTRAEATNSLGATMPPKGGAAITDAQVRAVAAYVWTLSH